MKAARYTQGAGLTFDEVTRPAIEPGEILLRVESAGICGTDVKIAKHGHRKLRDGQTITLGHEFIGRVEQSNSDQFKPGQRVGIAPNLGCGTCEMCHRGLLNMCPDYTAFGITFDGAHAPFLRIPSKAIEQKCIFPLPDYADPIELVLAEPLSCALNGLRAVNFKSDDFAVIYGAGPMGLLATMLCVDQKCRRIIVIDRNNSRLALASELGATDTINNTQHNVPNWIRVETKNRGVDFVLTAIPSAEIQQEALAILAPFGRLSLFAGLPRGASEVPIDTNAIHYKNLLVTGTTGGSPADYRAAVELIQSRRVNARKVVSHVFSFDQMDQAYSAAMTRGSMKVVLAGEGVAK